MKLLSSIFAAALCLSAAQAATITVSSGLTSQGFLVTDGGQATAGHFVAVGNFNTLTGVFTVFGSAVADTAKVNTSPGIAATGPSTFNGTIIDVFVGLGNSIESSGAKWVVLRSNANTAFPADVSGTAAVTFAATLPTTVSIIGRGDAGNGFGLSGTTNTINMVPEPSTALLGLLGIAGLIRRRR
jgi:hypothetical protein